MPLAVTRYKLQWDTPAHSAAYRETDQLVDIASWYDSGDVLLGFCAHALARPRKTVGDVPPVA